MGAGLPGRPGWAANKSSQLPPNSKTAKPARRQPRYFWRYQKKKTRTSTMTKHLHLTRSSLFAGALLLLATTFTAAQIPGPDPTFGRFGAAWYNVYPTDDQVFGITFRPDGRAVAAGRTTVDSVPQMAVFQYKTDGQLDLDFHWNGKGALAFNTSPSAAHAVAVDAEGRTVLAGYVTVAGNEQFSVVRLLPSGAYDPAFGTGGRVNTDFNGGQDQANAVAIQPDGKIVAAGFTRNGPDADFALARYLPDGSSDVAFGTGGRVVTKIDFLADIIRDIVVQSSGRIIVCGTTAASQVFNAPSFFAVARYLPDGSLDPTFGGLGNVITDVGADEESDIARSVTLLPAGQIVVAGYSGVSFASKISVVRYRPNGLLDATFGSLGVAQTEIFANSGNFCTDLTALPDNSLLLSGMAENVDFKDIFLLKMLENGTLDASFGQNGKVVRSLSPKDDNAYGLARRPDGRILVVGDTRKDGDFYTDAAVLQFNANGSVDAAFGSSGAVVEDVGTSEDNGLLVLAQPDEKVLVGGLVFTASNNSDWALARFQGNGQPDHAFGTNAIQAYNFSNRYDLFKAIAPSTTGKVLCGGRIDGKPALTQILSNGLLDNTFGSGGKMLIDISPNWTNGVVNAVVRLPNENLLVLSTDVPATSLLFFPHIRRLLPNGKIDSTFGVNGRVLLPGNRDNNHMVLLPDGKMLTMSHFIPTSPIEKDHTIINRYNANGSLDLSFGNGGQYRSPNYFLGYDLVLQPNGSILALGTTGYCSALRITSEGVTDPTFNGTGQITLVDEGISKRFNQGVVQKDGRIVAVSEYDGTIYPKGDYVGFDIARLNSNGALDGTWGQSGFLRLRGYQARDIALDADGNILAAGSISNGERSDIVVYRILRGEYVGTADRPNEAGSRILNVFPNPVGEQLALEYDLIDNQEVGIKMYDMGGRLLHTLLSGAPRFSGKNMERITLPAGLAAGMYTVAVETGRGSVAVQVVVR